jgi:hypothetical protein
MKRNFSIIEALHFFILLALALVVVSCSNNDNQPTDIDTKTTESIVGTYLWAQTVYDMGTDGASRLAEMYSDLGYTDVFLLCKGTNGTVSYSKTTFSKAPLSFADRDILQEVVTAMRAKGINVHAWLMYAADNAYLKINPSDGVYHFRTGYSTSYADIRSETYKNYMVKILKELKQNYDIKGFMFDHLRYAGAYFGWSDAAYKALTTTIADGGYGLSLDEYNEVVRQLGYEYNYPIGKNDQGRYVYDNVNPLIHENVPGTLTKAAANREKAVSAFMQMRVDNVDDVCQTMVDAADGYPTRIAAMGEIAQDVTLTALQYGQECNKKYIFSEICPMLYSKEYGKTYIWVSQSIATLSGWGYEVTPSLQAYRNSTSETIDVNSDVTAAINGGCRGFILFRTGTYDIARGSDVTSTQMKLTYYKASTGDSGILTVTLDNNAVIRSVTPGGKFQKSTYTLTDGVLRISTSDFKNIGDGGTILITFSEAKDGNTSVLVTSDARIVWTKNW